MKTYRLDRSHVIKKISADTKPALVIESGAVVELETVDCFGSQPLTPGVGPLVFDPDLAGNPSTGPIYVAGADPGDVLKVDILEIEPAPQAVMAMDETAGVYAEHIPEDVLKFFEVRGGRTFFDKQYTIQNKPMLGVIGNAPAAPAETDMSSPGPQGGNMDCRRIIAGSTVYLPVNVPGGLLALGDVHAVMGDGESCGCGAEVEARVKIRAAVLKNVHYPCPLVCSEGYAMSVYSALTLDEAADCAARAMHGFLQEALGLSYTDAAMLLSLKGDLRICQVVNPVKTCRMEVPLEIFEAYGFQFE